MARRRFPFATGFDGIPTSFMRNATTRPVLRRPLDSNLIIEEFTPEEFLRFLKRFPERIVSVQVRPPIPGSEGFGKLWVKLKKVAVSEQYG